MKVGGHGSSYDHWRYAEDYDLAVRVARLFDVAAIPNYVCIYAISSTSVTSGHPMARLIGLCIVKARSLALANNPIDIAKTLFSVVRSVEIDLTSRFTKNRFAAYCLNMRTLESKL